MKKTLTLPESEIITLADAAKKHGTVELAKAIGIGKTQLYRILSGHNQVIPATAEKIDVWLSTGIPQPEKTEEPPKSEQRRTRPTKSDIHNPRIYTLSGKPSIYWSDPKFLRIAVCKVAAAILQGRLKNVSITIDGGHCKCGD